MKKQKVLIVVSNYYKDIADGLVKGATEYLDSRKDTEVFIGDGIDVEYSIHKVPGAFEIPFFINMSRDLFDGFIALGCIIRGETYHFEVISNEVTRKLMDLSIDINKPVGFGVITCETLKQATERSDPNNGNKGAEAAKGLCEFNKISRKMDNKLKSKTRLTNIQLIFQHISTNDDIDVLRENFDKYYKNSSIENFGSKKKN